MRHLTITVYVSADCVKRLKAFADVLNHTFGMGKDNTPETVLSTLAENAANGDSNTVAERLTGALFQEAETIEAQLRLNAFAQTLIDAAGNGGETDADTKGGAA